MCISNILLVISWVLLLSCLASLDLQLRSVMVLRLYLCDAPLCRLRSRESPVVRSCGIQRSQHRPLYAQVNQEDSEPVSAFVYVCSRQVRHRIAHVWLVLFQDRLAISTARVKALDKPMLGILKLARVAAKDPSYELLSRLHGISTYRPCCY